MKSTTISAATIALLVSLTSAAPTTQAVVRIQLETEIETFVQDTVPFNVLFKTANKRRLDSGLEAKIVGTTGIPDSSKVSCQAFDANNKPLGAPFTTVTDGVFSTNGQPVPIDAYLCSNMGGETPASNMGANGAAVPKVDTQSSTTARIELEFDSDGFIQEEIPIGQLVLTKSKYILLNVMLLESTNIS